MKIDKYKVETIELGPHVKYVIKSGSWITYGSVINVTFVKFAKWIEYIYFLKIVCLNNVFFVLWTMFCLAYMWIFRISTSWKNGLDLRSLFQNSTIST